MRLAFRDSHSETRTLTGLCVHRPSQEPAPRDSHSETRTPRLVLKDSHSETRTLRLALQLCSRNAQSCHTVMSLKSLNLSLPRSSQPHMHKVSHPVLQSLLKVDTATHEYGPRHPNILAFQYLCWFFQRSALSQHNPMYHSH